MDKPTTPPDFTEQARQLAQEELSPHELPDGQIVINRLIAAFASVLAEAATQGQIVGVERAVAITKARIEDIPENLDIGKPENAFEAGYLRAAFSIKLALAQINPDPSYLDRVRNEAASVVVNGLAQDVLEVCKTRGWSLRWTHRGAYLHLESSELIEAIRGKHGDPLKEAADVLLVLMSITENQGIPFDAVLERARLTANELKSKPHYAGEEYDDGSR